MDIHELIGRALRNEASYKELSVIESWKSQDKFNTKLYNQYHTIWQNYASLRSAAEIPEIIDWANFLQGQHTPQNINYIKWLGLAASFLLFGIFIHLMLPTAQGTLYETGSGQITAYTLEDGSTVWLNKNAKIRYKQDDDHRLVTLEGEAFFEVAHNPDVPFIINTGELRTQVVGTSFNIDQTEEQTMVSVEKGKVKVYEENRQSLLLTSGMAADYDVNTGILKEKIGGVRNAFSWKTGILSFENVSIQEVIKDLEMHFETSLFIENNQSQAHLTANFDNQSLESVLHLIEVITDEKIKITQ